ncbi:MAG TPA: tyrosine recombinase XerD, partial [Flavobacteriales bacterium]|nr:tyrosine recombinase XerD [Flavobacteriales bacterium]
MRWSAEIKGFESYLKLEKGLSPKSIEAYLSDVTKLVQYLDTENTEVSLSSVKLGDLRKFLVWLAELGMSARSQARIISGLKAFFSYLSMEDIIKGNPAELLEAPKLSRKLPVVLSLEEINAIIDSIDLSKDSGQRNKAMLETLYGSGLRVTELI